MTTAHRPTWKSAFGLADSIGKGYTPTRSYSARVLYLTNIGSSRLLEIKRATMGTRISRLTEIKRLQIRVVKKIKISQNQESHWRSWNRQRNWRKTIIKHRLSWKPLGQDQEENQKAWGGRGRVNSRSWAKPFSRGWGLRILC